MRPKTSTNKGAVELPLTYLYAVLIGIVVFIVATRVIGVHGQSTDEQNTRLILETINDIIEASAHEPNIIRTIELPRTHILLEWDSNTMVTIGRHRATIGIPVFSHAQLSEQSAAWTYPYRVETASSPLLFLTEKDATLYFIANLTPETESVREAIYRETPRNADVYGLKIVRADRYEHDRHELCIRHENNTWFDCNVRLISQRAPYGYLSWDDTWYPVVSYGEIFAALFAAGEDEWADAIANAQARDRINRDVLIKRAELFKDGGFRDECKDIYEASGGNLTAIRDAIELLDPLNSAPSDLHAFAPIPSAITNLSRFDRELTRYDCPTVIR